jgi:hypothetical protein
MHKHIPLLILMTITTCSCSNNYSVQINGTVKKTEINNLFYENDSFKIDFNFANAEKEPLFIFNIHNKLKQPLFIDWKNSIVMLNNESVNFMPNNAAIFLNRDTLNRDILNNNNYSIANIELPYKQSILIPNNTISAYSPFYFKNSFVFVDTLKEKKIKDNLTHKKEFPYIQYNQQNTPQKLRLYLAIADNSQYSNTNYYDFNFWIESICIYKNKNELTKYYKDSSTSNYTIKAIRTE